MATIAQVRDGLVHAIQSGCGLRAKAYASDSIPAPCAIITRAPMDPDFVFGRATATYPFIVRVFAGRSAEVAAQKQLDALTELDGDGSLIAAVQDLNNWPVVVRDEMSYCKVTGIGAVPESVSVADESFLSVEFNIEVVF